MVDHIGTFKYTDKLTRGSFFYAVASSVRILPDMFLQVEKTKGNKSIFYLFANRAKPASTSSGAATKAWKKPTISDPEVLGHDIVEDLEGAREQFRGIENDLGTKQEQ
jgi:hypothetical protein